MLLFVTTASFDSMNLISGLVYMVTLPFVAIATTYLYHDLAVRESLRETQVVSGGVLPGRGLSRRRRRRAGRGRARPGTARR